MSKIKMELLIRPQQNIKSLHTSAQTTKNNNFTTKIRVVSDRSEKDKKVLLATSALFQQIEKNSVSVQSKKIKQRQSNGQLNRFNLYTQKGRIQYFPRRKKIQQEGVEQQKEVRGNFDRYLSLLKLGKCRPKQNAKDKTLQIKEFNTDLIKQLDKNVKDIAKAKLSLLIPKLIINKTNRKRQFRQTTQLRSKQSLNCTVVNIFAAVIKNKVDPIHKIYGKSSYLNSTLKVTSQKQNNDLFGRSQQAQIQTNKKTHKKIMYSSKINLTEHIPLKKTKIKKQLFDSHSNKHTKKQTKPLECLMIKKGQQKQLRPWSTQQISFHQ